MGSLTRLWARLDTRRRVITIAAALGMFLAVLGIARLAGQPGMALLYGGLEPAAAGEVITALEQRGIAHEARGGAIYVDAGKRDSLRMSLAAEGLPATGPEGYEVLDSLSGFSTTAQMFDAAFWRAKEGELARTVQASPGVRAARVHIAAPSSQPFERETETSASVTITLSGGRVMRDRAQAVRHLVSAAVPGMSPPDVEVIDGATLSVVPADGPAGMAGGGDDPLAAALREKVSRIVAARLGPGRTEVEISVERDRRSERVSETRIDPDSRVVVSSETRDSSTASTEEGAAAGVTVASNLPEGDDGGESSAQRDESRTVERVNYDFSETRREMEKAPGAIERLSVAVLIDREGSTGPLEESEITDLTELVSAAVGAKPGRGDTVTVKAMALPDAQAGGTRAEPSLWSRLGLDVMALVQLATLAIIALVLGLFVLRPILAGRRAVADARLPSPGNPGDERPGITDGAADTNARPEASDGTGTEVVPAGQVAWSAQPTASDPVDQLRQLIGERRGETVEVLRNWIDDEESTMSS